MKGTKYNSVVFSFDFSSNQNYNEILERDWLSPAQFEL